MKMVAQWRTASAKDYGILFGIFVSVNDSLETAKEEACKKASRPQPRGVPKQI
jgi:hypothetical protein